MKEWKLCRNSDSYISSVQHQENQPAFNPAFGNEEDFTWASRTLSLAEHQQLVTSWRRQHYPSPEEVSEAVMQKELGNNAPMTEIMARRSDVDAEYPMPSE